LLQLNFWEIHRVWADFEGVEQGRHAARGGAGVPGRFQGELSARSSSDLKKFALLWSFVSIGPWQSESTLSRSFWRRDQTPCFAFFPAKLKKNKNFNDHAAEAFARDSGGAAEVLVKKQNGFVDFPFAGDIAFGPVSCRILRAASHSDCLFRLRGSCIELLKSKLKKIELVELTGVYRRTTLHKLTAIEIFTKSGKPYLIDFPEFVNVKQILAKIAYLGPKQVIVQLSSFKKFAAAQLATRDWETGMLSNFAYLMQLNIVSGRTFNSQSQYPLFPWVLTNFDSLDLDDSSIFRDLRLPIGAINPAKQEFIRGRYLEMVADGHQAHFFSSGPLSPLVVSHLLVRLEPFTSSHVRYQGNRFDVPDRIFMSIAGTFMALQAESNEFWELTPEFFACPEFLVNANGFDLGVSEGESIGDVKLPNWASSPLEFVYLHRKALESEHVSQKLPHWIDLIWGVHQRDPEKGNVYHPNLYEDVWKSKPKETLEIETFMRLIGQIPTQIFFTQHPHRQRIEHVNTHTVLQELLPKCDGFCIEATTSKLWLLIVSNLWIMTIQIGVDGKCVKKGINDVVSVASFRKCVIVSFSDNSFAHCQLTQGVVDQIHATMNRKIVSFAATTDWFSASSDDFVTTIYSINRKTPCWEIRSYRGTVTCSAISGTFKVHVVGTSDGALVLTSLTNGESVRVINLGDVTPIEVMITPTWGFLLTNGIEVVDDFERFCLIVHTINGGFVRKRLLDVPIAAPTVFCSSKGFDYLAYAIGSKLFVCEVFFLKERKVLLGGIRGNLKRVEFLQERHIFVLVDDGGQIELVSYIPDDFADVC
jgi:hypothetical protein